MRGILERLRSLRVSDLMTKGVVQLRAWQPMGEVAALFRSREISAAPVVDEQGRCVGILSATDFLQRDANCGDRHAPGSLRCSCRIDDGREDVPLHVTSPAEDSVAEWMTSTVQSVTPETPLSIAAQMMCAQHIHRLVVLDAGHHVCGMVSTMDVAAALVNALDESFAGSLKVS